VRRAIVALAAAGGALAIALAVSAVVLGATGHDPRAALAEGTRFSARADSVVSIVNRAVPLYLAGLAAAVAFRAGLFNIGVEGQYRLAALAGAAAGSAVALPPILHVPLIVAVAAATGAAWSGIAGVLRVRRDVSEVISTIMLNVVAAAVAAQLLRSGFAGGASKAGPVGLATAEIPRSGRMPSLDRVLTSVGMDLPAGSHIGGMLLLAMVAGVVVHLVLFRTRFGFDVRTLGRSRPAAAAAGVDPDRTLLRAMVASGAVAGLVGLPALLGSLFRYGTDFPAGLGFAGVAVALVGRNHPAGVALAAVLFAFLERAAQVLDLAGIPRELALITQGTVVLAVVVAYAAADRIEERRAARLAGTPAPERRTAAVASPG
jgi:general nucleoside transport system permease protein